MTTLVPAKPWWQSKTIWLNAIALVVAIITAVTDVLQLSEDATQVVLAVTAALNVILRFFTTQPVAATGGEIREIKP